MGHKQELYRGFPGFMSFAFCFTAVSVILSISLGFMSAVSPGGPVETVWSWIISFFFCVISGLAVAEITSVYPSAGSVYHWAGQLSAAETAPAWSYIMGWFNLLGNMAGSVPFAFANATVISCSVEIQASPSAPANKQVCRSESFSPGGSSASFGQTARDGRRSLPSFSSFPPSR